MSCADSQGKAALEKSVRGETRFISSRALGPATISTPMELVRRSKRTEPSVGMCFLTQSWSSRSNPPAETM